MKYVVILGDGMADLPIESLGGKTPLEAANIPNINSLARDGVVGLCKTVPNGFKPGSDVANMSVMGYAPEKYYTGRSPIEALSMGIELDDDDLAIRCNLVTLSNEQDYKNKTMTDYSSGEISTKEASELLREVNRLLGNKICKFYAGVSYRHCLIVKGGRLGTELTPPHDITNKKITNFLPSGINGSMLLKLMEESYKILSNHPINKKRIAEGKNPANSIWLWGEGTKPKFESFKKLNNLEGAVISAVDLVKGLGVGTKMQVIEVEGATGTINTNFLGKAEACINALKKGTDYVYLHIEAPDECGHHGDLKGKIKSIELIDKIVVTYVKRELDKLGEPYRLLIMPDHPTPIASMTHTSHAVPFVLYDRDGGRKSNLDYNEKSAEQSKVYYDSGEALIKEFLRRNK